MKPPDNMKYLLFGGTFVLANKLQFIGDKRVPGLTTKQWFLLRNLIELPDEPLPSITQIAQIMDSSRQNVAKMLEVMERDNLITIEKSDFDHRSRGVRITETGIYQLKQSTENSRGFLDAVYKDIDREKLAIAGEVLLKMLQNLHEMQDE